MVIAYIHRQSFNVLFHPVLTLGTCNRDASIDQNKLMYGKQPCTCALRHASIQVQHVLAQGCSTFGKLMQSDTCFNSSLQARHTVQNIIGGNVARQGLD